MNIFESFGGKHAKDISPAERKEHGLENICEECDGKGRKGSTIFTEGRVCGQCHGKGFLHEESAGKKTDQHETSGVAH